MINKIGYAVNINKKQPNFTGKEKTIAKILRGVTEVRDFIKQNRCIKHKGSVTMSNFSSRKIKVGENFTGKNITFDTCLVKGLAYLNNFNGRIIQAAEIKGRNIDLWGLGCMKAKKGSIKLTGKKNIVDGIVKAESSIEIKNLDTLNKVISENGFVTLTGKNKAVKGVNGKQGVHAENLNTKGSVISEEGPITLIGEKNQVSKNVVGKQSIYARNLATSGGVYSQESIIMLLGQNNIGTGVISKLGIHAENLTTNADVICEHGPVTLIGENYIDGNLVGTSFDLSANTTVTGKKILIKK